MHARMVRHASCIFIHHACHESCITHVTHHAYHVMNCSCFCSMEDAPEKQLREHDEVCVTPFVAFVYSWVCLLIQDHKLKRKQQRALEVWQGLTFFSNDFFPDPFLACPLPRLEPSQIRSVEDHVTWKRLKHLERSHPSTQVLHIALVSSRLVLYGLLSCSRPHLQMNLHLKSSTTCPRQKEYTSCERSRCGKAFAALVSCAFKFL